MHNDREYGLDGGNHWMGLYKCVVYDKDKKRRKIKLELDSEEEVNDYIGTNELTMVSMRSTYNKNKDNIKNSTKIKDKEIRILCRQMGILLESACEITKMIDILINQSNRKISNVLSQISNHIKRGNSITQSFQKSELFSTFFIPASSSIFFAAFALLPLLQTSTILSYCLKLSILVSKTSKG